MVRHRAAALYPGSDPTSAPFVRAAAAGIAAALSVTVAACGSARVGAPVARPFPAPPGATSGTDLETTPVSFGRWGGADFPRYLEMVEQVETGGDCFASPAGVSAIGCYQMTRAALMDVGFKDVSGDWLDNAWGVDSDDEFRANRRAQEAAMLRYTTKNWLNLEPCVRDLLGTTVGGVALDQAALLAGAHLLGATGLIRFVRCGLQVHCISPEAAAWNGGGRNLRAIAVRRMSAVHGLRVLASATASGSRCVLQGRV